MIGSIRAKPLGGPGDLLVRKLNQEVGASVFAAQMATMVGSLGSVAR